MGNDGKGYDGKYCCPGCAKGTGCECGEGTSAQSGKAQQSKERKVSSQLPRRK